MAQTPFTPDRRVFLASATALLALPACAKIADGGAADTEVSMFIGTYNSDTAKGIYPLQYSSATDAFTLGAAVPAAENVSFAAYSAKTKRRYLLNEKDDGKVGVYDDTWTPGGEVSSHGANPCYAATDATGSYLAVANYSSGNVVVYKLRDDGSLADPVIRQNKGTGPNTDRQEGPHAHWVQFQGSYIYSVDLGTDQVLGYSFDAATGAVGEAFEAFKAPAGAGPRHLAFSSNGSHAWLVTELSNVVIVLKKGESGRFEAIQTISTLAESFSGQSYCAHIMLNKAGNRLYVSNRGDNSIAVFEVAADATLKLLQVSPTLGDWPRFFLLLEDQKRLVVAHQRSNNLVVFEIKDDGTLAPKDQKIAVSQPVYIGVSG